MRKILIILIGIRCLVPAYADAPPHASAPSVLVLHDGPEKETNPGYLDALYLANLLGHFTTLRQVRPLSRPTRAPNAPFHSTGSPAALHSG